MKKASPYFTVIICLLILFFAGCKKLKRDNPLDANNNTTTSAVKGPVLKFSKYLVYADNNGDQQINKGESIKLQVYLKNSGTSVANKVRGTISCSSSYITALSPFTAASYYDSNYNDYIDAGAEGSPLNTSSYLSFNVSNTTPNGTIITFSLTVTDETNTTWTDVFTITVVSTGAAINFSKYEIYSDNNGDQQINKGESIKLKVYIKNNGSSKANKVRGTVSCSGSYISALSPVAAASYYDSNYNDYIDAGDEGSPLNTSSYVSFNVSNTTPNGTVITFSLTITDEANNTWTDTFTITVVGTGAVIGYSKYEVYADNNNNQVVNAGESVKLKVYLKNIGSSKANKVRATITCSSSYISAISPVSAASYYDQDYNDYIGAGDEGSPLNTSSYLSFNVSSSTPPGTVITFNLAVTDESNNTWSDIFTLTVY